MNFQATDDDGRTHVGWLQEQNESCGPACIYMIERWGRGGGTADGEARIRELYRRNVSENLLESVERARNDFRQRGIGINAVWGLLRLEGYSCSLETSFPVNFMDLKLPAIAEVAWGRGGAHFVVIAGFTRGGRAVILDPTYGLQQPLVREIPSYNTRPCRHARRSGRHVGVLNGIHIVVNQNRPARA